MRRRLRMRPCSSGSTRSSAMPPRTVRAACLLFDLSLVGWIWLPRHAQGFPIAGFARDSRLHHHSWGSAGMAFVQMMGERQGTNPEFAFLHGGEGAPYFAWALHCALNGQPAAAAARQAAAPSPAAAAPQYTAAPQAAGARVAQQQQQQQPAAAVQQQQPVSASPTVGVLADLPAEVSSGWSQVLGLLTASRDSIRNSQAWFMACAPYAAGMAEMMLQVRTRCFSVMLALGVLCGTPCCWGVAVRSAWVRCSAAGARTQ